MTIIGYHASHEQFSPSSLLDLSIKAEQAGFGAINSSDHFHPWSERQGQSGFSFAWLGAAMHATQLPFHMICAPGQRYHPAIVAQAIATIAEMFPGRFAISLGSGEAINESITGEAWPAKNSRDQRLRECYHIIKSLLQGNTVTHKGLVEVENARLYTLPAQQPVLLGAALSKETAAWMGDWMDGLITAHKSYEQLSEIVAAFRKNGGTNKKLYLKVQLSYSKNEKEALTGAYEQWRTNVIPNISPEDLAKVTDFDTLAESISLNEIKKAVHVSADPEEHVETLKKYAELGFDKIFLHNVNKEQEQFIKDFGEKVLPFF
jgi:coenzyme F420-dependent glucose-6-phosphate dehydrogenase